MAYIQRRKTSEGTIRYRVLVRLKGYPTQAATFQKLSDAKSWANQTEIAIKAGKYFKISEAKKHTLAQLIDRYSEDYMPTKEKSKQESLLQWWKSQLGLLPLADITPAVIAEQRDKLSHGITNRGKKRAPATVVQYLAVLSHCFTIAVREYGWVDDSPLRKVTKPKLPRGRTRFLSDEERGNLLKTCYESKNQYLYMAVVIALSTGLRKAELMNLRFEDIDLQKGRITIHVTKNGDIRVVPLKGLACKLLQEHAKTTGQHFGLIFQGKERGEQKSIDLRFPWKQALKKAGIEDFCWHSLRHSTASYLAMNGCSLVEIAEVLGHKTLQMVKRYAHLSETHTAAVIESMNEKIFNFV